MEGETNTERFGIAIPFADRLEGIDENGKQRIVGIDCFENMLIQPRWPARVLPTVWISNVRFRLVRLPFRWSALQFHLSLLLSQFANEMGLSRATLKHELRTDFPDYSALAQIEIQNLSLVVQYVKQHWGEVSSELPPPSREIISATLAALSMRNRSRGRHARRK